MKRSVAIVVIVLAACTSPAMDEIRSATDCDWLEQQGADYFALSLRYSASGDEDQAENLMRHSEAADQRAGELDCPG